MADAPGAEQQTTNSSAPVDANPATKRRNIAKIVLFIALAAFVVFLAIHFRERLSLAALAERESEFVEFGRAHPVQVVAILFALYVTVTGLSIPAATVLTIVNAWLSRQLFGPVAGFIAAVLLVSFASTLGATLSFMLSRYLLRDAVQDRFGHHLSRFNEAFDREGAFYLFTLRLIAHAPFFVVNAVMGLTLIPTRTFWWVSQLGMLPGTFLFVYTGWAVPSLHELVPQLEQRGVWAILSPQLIVAFVLLGLFPLAMKKIVARVQRNRRTEHGG